MRLMIRFADRIVGASVVFALGAVVFVIIMLGINQRWFARDYEFLAHFPSADGLSQNMPVKHLGFSIGQVRSFEPTADGRVRARFSVFGEYRDRAREGSRVELVVSPIPILGSQFLLFPGDGAELPEGSEIYAKAVSDAIGSLIGDVAGIVGDVGAILSIARGALEGTDETALGRTMGHVEGTVGGLAQTVESIVAGAVSEILGFAGAQLEPIIGGEMSLLELIDGEGGEVYAGIVEALGALAGILRDIEGMTAQVPPQLPQVFAMLRDVQDLVIALSAMPLVRSGAPERLEAPPAGALARDLEF